jgi:hypothetical protein
MSGQVGGWILKIRGTHLADDGEGLLQVLLREATRQVADEEDGVLLLLLALMALLPSFFHCGGGGRCCAD